MFKSAKENFGNLLCYLGFHEFAVIEVKFGFGASGNVEIVECERCGYKATRRSRNT